MHLTDFTFTELEIPAPPSRVVSLVPSITETLFAIGAESTLVGRTRYCISPEGARAVTKVGGTKDPDLQQILALKPDLVLANKEENRREDILHLREQGLTVYVDNTTTVEESLALVNTLGGIFEQPVQELVAAGVRAVVQAHDRVSQLEEQNKLRLNPRPDARPGVVAFIWREPWMAVGKETYAGDLIHTLGGRNLLADSPERYPVVTPEQVASLKPDILLFPDEPFAFKTPHLQWWRDTLPTLPAVQHGRLRPCDGQDFCWFGARTAGALSRLASLCAW